MTRGLILAALVVAGVVTAVLAAPQPTAAPAPSAAALQIEHVRGNLYLVRGGGRVYEIGGVKVPQSGTTAAFITAKGVVLVDTKMPGWGQPIIDKLKEITDKPVTTIINTHTHMDHVGGNVQFPAAVEVVAHENTASLMKEMRPVTGGPVQPNVFKDNNGRGLPARTYKDRLTLGSGDDRVELHYFGRAHTSGDTWVVFPAARAVHSGDAFAGKGVPPLDANNGASGVEYPKTIARAIAALANVDTVITGHYQTALTMADLKTFEDFMREFVEAVQATKRAGRTIDDFVRSWKIPERFLKAGYTSTEHLRSIRADVEVIWNESQ